MDIFIISTNRKVREMKEKKVSKKGRFSLFVFSITFLFLLSGCEGYGEGYLKSESTGSGGASESVATSNKELDKSTESTIENALMENLIRIGLSGDFAEVESLEQDQILDIWRYSQYPPFAIQHIEKKEIASLISVTRFIQEKGIPVSEQDAPEIGDGDPDYLIIVMNNGKAFTLTLIKPYVYVGQTGFKVVDEKFWDALVPRGQV